MTNGIAIDGQRQSTTLNAMFDFIKEQVPTAQMIEEAHRQRDEAEKTRAENKLLKESLRQAIDIQKGKSYRLQVEAVSN